MNPIISPVWFYLIHIANMAHGLSFVLLVVSIFSLMLLSAGGVDFNQQTEKENSRLRNKWVNICIIVMVVCNILFLLIPDENTMYAMLATSVVTPDNISVGEEHIINLITNIVNAINSAK